jgi:DNA repair protein RadC
MATYEPGQQLPLPLAPRPGDPQVADSTPASPARRTAAHKLPGELSDAELLTTLLGPSTAVLCEGLMASYSNLREVAALNPSILVAHGFTTGAVTRLEVVFEVAKRYGETEWVPGQPFRGSGDIYAHFRERLAVETCELFYAVLLDNKHRKIRDVVVSKGSLTSSIVHPRDVFGQIVRHAAAAVVFVHNHPSGDPTPSKEDLEITRRLREVGDLIGVRVLDHIVIGRGRYVSFVDDGYW